MSEKGEAVLSEANRLAGVHKDARGWARAAFSLEIVSCLLACSGLYLRSPAVSIAGAVCTHSFYLFERLMARRAHRAAVEIDRLLTGHISGRQRPDELD